MTDITTQQPEAAIVHSTFQVTRHYPRTPARVFRAFADKEQVRRWRVEGDGFDIREFSYDFKVGGGPAEAKGREEGTRAFLESLAGALQA